MKEWMLKILRFFRLAKAADQFLTNVFMFKDELDPNTVDWGDFDISKHEVDAYIAGPYVTFANPVQGYAIGGIRVYSEMGWPDRDGVIGEWWIIVKNPSQVFADKPWKAKKLNPLTKKALKTYWPLVGLDHKEIVYVMQSTFSDQKLSIIPRRTAIAQTLAWNPRKAEDNA